MTYKNNKIMTFRKQIAFMLMWGVAVLCCSCETSCRYYRSYVDGYALIDTLSVYTCGDNTMIGVWVQASRFVSFESQGADKVIYDSLCTVHNDLTYNQIDKLPNFGYPNRVCSGSDFVNIDVVCLQQYDERHSPKSSLSDVVRFLSMSPKKFIDDDYNKYNWNKYRRQNDISTVWCEMYGSGSTMNRPYFYPIDQLLADLTEEDLTLLCVSRYNGGFIGFLLFSQLPVQSGSYDFLLIFTDNHGCKFTTPFSMTW